MSSDRLRSDRAAQAFGADLDWETAEDLLAGTWRDPRAVTHPVAGMLAAAAAPSRADELRGEEAAMAAYRQVHKRSRAGRRRRAHRAGSALIRACTAKAIAVTVAAGTVLGGLAAAAATDHLPRFAQDRDPRPAASSTSLPPKSPQPSNTSSAPDERPGSPPSPKMRGLCRAYLSAEAKDQGPTPATANPAFARLIAAAGGPDKVTDYCGTVLRPAGQDGKPSKPAEKGTGKAEAPDDPTGGMSFSVCCQSGVDPAPRSEIGGSVGTDGDIETTKKAEQTSVPSLPENQPAAAR